MGPRFNGVEDHRLRRPQQQRQSTRLQWGHALMAWKTALIEIRDGKLYGPSMGPRFNGVEDEAIEDNPHSGRAPSMGPRFNGVEDPPAEMRELLARAILQWGHALMAWKTWIAESNGLSDIHLQWGHALMAWKTA